MNKPATFKIADLRRAIKVAKAEGLDVVEIIVTNGDARVIIKKLDTPQAKDAQEGPRQWKK